MAKPKKVQGQDYMPYGAEWKKELMKLSKNTLVGMLKDLCKKIVELEKTTSKLKK